MEKKKRIDILVFRLSFVVNSSPSHTRFMPFFPIKS
jgi:hypothetical protein